MSDVTPQQLDDLYEVMKQVVEAVKEKSQSETTLYLKQEDTQLVKLDGPVELDDKTVEVVNFKELAEYFSSLKESIDKAAKDSRVDTVKIANLGEIKLDSSPVVKKIGELSQITKLLAKQKPEVIVQAPDAMTIRNWPTNPEDAVAVRLVDKTGKRFYDSFANFMQSAGPSMEATNAKLDEIITNTADIEVKAETINLNTDTLETKITTTNTSLATIAGAVSGNEVQVDVLTMPTVTVATHHVTNAGTFAVQVDGDALTALQLIDDTVATHDSAAVSKGQQWAGEYSASP